MPSMQIFIQSGGVSLTSGDIFSGLPYPIGGVQLVLDRNAPGPIAVCASGIPTAYSGGVFSSGGLADGIRMYPGDAMFFPKAVMYNLSGLQRIDAIRCVAAAASSGGILNWYAM